jgi:putative SOS response-associated peptidase YedK
MCGRVFLTHPGAAFLEQFAVEGAFDWEPQYNVAPGDTLPIVRQGDTGARELATARWGLVPRWAKDPTSGPRPINARSETVAEKPTFRTAYRKRRCIVAVSGFYEWWRGSKPRRAFQIQASGGELLALAGLWERWASAAGDALDTCTILTQESVRAVRPIHDRSPLLLRPEDYDDWLDPSNEPQLHTLAARANTRPLAVDELNGYVNNARNQGPECHRRLLPWTEAQRSALDAGWSYEYHPGRDGPVRTWNDEMGEPRGTPAL